MELVSKPYQERAVKQVFDALYEGYNRVLLVMPTGSGKTHTVTTILRQIFAMQPEWKIALYTNRKTILSQTHSTLHNARILHGVRAAGYEEDFGYRLQLCSIQTEHARCITRSSWPIHAANLVVIDEAHLNKGEMVEALLTKIAGELGHPVIVLGVTATPLDLGDMYERFIIPTTIEECRTEKMLTWAHHYGPDEPDFDAFEKLRKKLDAGDDISEADARKAMMTPGIFGRVYEWYQKLNPDRRPAILFAPGVNESLWFAKKFADKGVRSAHISGNRIWLDGEQYQSTDSLREDIFGMSKDGKLPVICNRFVLREGADLPWLYHGICATIVANFGTYLQMAGRLLRHWPGTDHCVWQDHGGHWWRFGGHSINHEVDWRLGDTNVMATALRTERVRQRKATLPNRCPACARIVNGPECPCGVKFTKTVMPRPVIGTDGELKLHNASPLRARSRWGDRCANCREGCREGCLCKCHTFLPEDGIRLWIKMYHRARSAKWDATFRQAIAYFAHEHFKWPQLDWPLMPLNERDLFRKVSDVPRERLVPGG